MKRTLTILVCFLTAIQINAQSICTTCTITLSGAANYTTLAGSERICITGSYTGNINVNNNSDAWICITGTWAPTSADYSGTANLAKIDVTSTGTLTAPALILNKTALTNSGTVHLTGANGNLALNGGGQGSSILNHGTITVDNGDLIGPTGGNGFIDNFGSITLVAAGHKFDLSNYNGTAGLNNRPSGTITVNGNFIYTSNGGTPIATNSGIINTLGTAGTGIGDFINDNETATNSTFYNYGFITTRNFSMANSELEFYNYCSIDAKGNFTLDRGSDAAAGIHGPTTASGYVGKISVAGVSTYVDGVFIVSGEQQDFCDAGVPAGGWDGTDPAAGGWTTCTRAAICVPPLPVSLLSFTGEIKNGAVILSWATASEVNNKKFIIEHSHDLSEWEAIGEVLGSGNSLSIMNYSFIDYATPGGLVYYRLRQVDVDGRFAYSNVVPVETGELSVSISPNPFDNALTISSSLKRALNISIQDVLGRLLYQVNLDGNNEPVKIFPELPSGAYVITIQTETFIEQRKIIKK